jgi:hypothetical protein
MKLSAAIIAEFSTSTFLNKWRHDPEFRSIVHAVVNHDIQVVLRRLECLQKKALKH